MAVELYDAVEPRADVLAGTLTDAVFAASLDEVVAGTAPDAYGDSDAFFAATHPSSRTGAFGPAGTKTPVACVRWV